jgi:hypothetical protein
MKSLHSEIWVRHRSGGEGWGEVIAAKIWDAPQGLLPAIDELKENVFVRF